MLHKLHLVPLLFTAIAAQAATLQQLSMDQMSSLATSVVRATVTGSSAAVFANSGNTIYTTYKLSVSEVWKGAATTEVSLPGGAVNGKRQSFPGIPELRIGGEYVLFLWKSPTTGIIHTLGLTQGIFDVTGQADAATAIHKASGELMLDSSGQRVADRATTLTLSDMRSRVRGTKVVPQ